jgi:hypothetical protein
MANPSHSMTNSPCSSKLENSGGAAAAGSAIVIAVKPTVK